jgi:hypothetical protein
MRLLVFLLALAVVASPGVARAASSDREVFIFKGGSLSQDGITPGSWGSGKAIESAEKVLTGVKAIRITTQGLYAGGRIDFAQPVPLFSDGIDATRYMVFAFFFDAVQTIDPGAGTVYSYDIEPYTIPKASIVRFVFVSDTGKVVSVEEPTNPLDPDDNWSRVAVPLAKFKTLGEDVREFRLKRLLVFTDLPSTLHLGEVKLVTDVAPIKVEPLSSQTVVIYDEVIQVAVATGGVSSLKYSWDFDASNGIQEESTGKVGRFVYTRGGEFTITLTVSDVDNLKAPATATAVVSVTD